MTNQMKNVPELRFPEFDGEWEEGTIKSLVHGNLSDGDWINKEYLLPNGKYRIIQTGNISVGKYLNKEKSSKFISQSSYDELKANEVFPGDILISRLADPAGRSIIMPNINWKMVTSVDVAIIRPNKKFESYFLISILNTDKKLYDISKLVSGTSHKRISRKNLEKVKIIYPKIQEQQKIGNFFSKLDRQIELEEQKLEKLNEQKKGYMQKIFSQELRFKDNNGEEYPKWESKKLEEVAIINTGKSKIVNEESAAYSNLGSTGVLGKSSHYEYDGNFILTARVGHYAGKLYNFSGKANISDNTIFLETDLNLNFTLNMLNNYNLKRIAFGSGQPLIKSSELKKLIFNIPCGEEEQKIGGFLSGFDSLIGKQSHKIELLKERKKGFLQKMFV